MAAKPRTVYHHDKAPRARTFIAACGGYGRFGVRSGERAVKQLYQGVWVNVGLLDAEPRDLTHFKEVFTAWWEAIAPWETTAYDIIIYDRLGRPLGVAKEHKPTVAKKEMRRLLDEHNGARGVVLKRNTRTLEVTQVAGFKRRPRRATATP